MAVTLDIDTAETVDFEAGEPVLLTGDKTYVHTQGTASDTWSITHNMGKRPAVTIVDSADSVVVGDVTYIDDNSLIVQFSGAFTGKAYLN